MHFGRTVRVELCARHIDSSSETRLRPIFLREKDVNAATFGRGSGTASSAFDGHDVKRRLRVLGPRARRPVRRSFVRLALSLFSLRSRSRVYNLAFICRVELSRFQFGSCMLNRGFHILGLGSANRSELATIDSTSRVALRTIKGSSGASPHKVSRTICAGSCSRSFSLVHGAVGVV